MSGATIASTTPGTAAMCAPAKSTTQNSTARICRIPQPRWAPFPKYYFVGGNNDPEQVPVEGLIEAAASALRREGSKLAIYNLGLGPLGYPALRSSSPTSAKRQRGIEATIDDILITTGSGQGLDMISRLLIKPGRHRAHRGILLPRRDQPVPQAGRQAGGNETGRGRHRDRCLVRSTRRYESSGNHAQIHLYDPDGAEPNGQHPAAGSAARADRVGSGIQVAIFEDECYADLLWEGIEAPPALYALDPGCVIHIGSFSKSLAPALRLGT